MSGSWDEASVVAYSLGFFYTLSDLGGFCASGV